MRFITTLNNQKCMEWKINATQGILFSLLYEANNWAVEEIIENLENKADKKEQYWNVRCFFNQITHWFGKPVNFYVAIKKYEAILSEFYAYDVFSAGIIRYKEHLLMIIYGSDE